MGQWTDRYKNHAIWARLSALGAAIDQAAQRDGNDASAVDDLERLRSVLSFAGKRLAGADPVLVHAPPLDELASALQNAETELLAFVTDGNAGHISNANTHADAALSHLSKVVIPLTPDDTGVLKDAAIAYRNTIERQLAKVSSAAARASEENKAASARANEEIAALKNKLAELATEITAERTRLTTTSTEFQGQFSSAQDSRSKEYTEAQTARQEKFSALIAEYQTKLAEQAADSERRRETATKEFEAELTALKTKYADSAGAVLAEMEKQKTRVEKLVGVIGNLGVTSGYLRSANQARWMTWIWQLLTVSALGLLIVFAWQAFLPVLNSTDGHAEGHPIPFSWSSFAARVLVTVAVGVLAAYTRSQGDKYLEIERRNRKLAMDFEALGPYLAPLPQNKQDDFRLAIGDRSFGRDESTAPKTTSPATALDLIGSEQIQEFIASIVKAAKPSKS